MLRRDANCRKEAAASFWILVNDHGPQHAQDHATRICRRSRNWQPTTGNWLLLYDFDTSSSTLMLPGVWATSKRLGHLVQRARSG